jgi:hypothetical protein
MNSSSTSPDLTRRAESDERSPRCRAANEGGVVALLAGVLRDFRERLGGWGDRRNAKCTETESVA